MNGSLFRNLAFDYIAGDSTRLRCPNDTGWRQLPCWVLVAPEGHGIHIEARAQGRRFCRADQAVLTPPNLPHRFVARSPGDCISHWSHVRFTLAGSLDVADFLEPPLIIDSAAAGRIKRINVELAELVKQETTPSIRCAGRRLELGAALLSLICSVSREKNVSGLCSPRLDRIRELLIYIDRHLHEPLDRDALAERAGISPARFHVVFERVVGMPPMSFVKGQRMKKAQVLLSETPRKIKDIGNEVGYPDAYTFSRAFRSTVGVSPTMYRVLSQRRIAPSPTGA